MNEEVIVQDESSLDNPLNPLDIFDFHKEGYFVAMGYCATCVRSRYSLCHAHSNRTQKPIEVSFAWD